jgi:hypothetical protein
MGKAQIVLGLGTSHTPLLSLPPELWEEYARGDQRNPELAYPPNGWVLPFEQGKDYIPPEIRAKYQGSAPFAEQYARCQRALDTLSDTLREAKPDMTIIVSDDQDEWLFENVMPRFAVYWGETAPVIPGRFGGQTHPAVAAAIAAGYGDQELEVPVACQFGRFLVEYLCDHDFDVAHMSYYQPPNGGKVARRYPTPEGELAYVRETPPRPQGLPHGFSFIVKRLFRNQPLPILPVMQNTCYPPNQPSARRSYQLGQAIARALDAWDQPARVAIVASGGLSHFVVDEELDRTVLGALERKDAEVLQSVPKQRLYSAASETLNWIAVGGALQDSALRFELLDYVPVYRTPAATGGGWAFGRWQ